MCRPCRPSCSPICFQTAGSKPVSVSICSRTAVSGDLLSRKLRTVLRSSSCSSVKAKFMVTRLLGSVVAPQLDACTRVYTHDVEQMGIRDLRAEAATVVRRAAAGERIVVTVAGRPMAQVGPLDPGQGSLTCADL